LEEVASRGSTFGYLRFDQKLDARYTILENLIGTMIFTGSRVSPTALPEGEAGGEQAASSICNKCQKQ
jgi:hypothetical protein